MSVTTDVNAPSLSTAGFEDGLGRRSIRFDREVGGILECLHLRPELGAFEAVLRATSTRIAALGDERFARTFGFEREPHGLTVLSELPSGERLSDIIDTQRSEEAGVSALDAAVGLLLQVMPALAKLHGAGISHGTLSPGRIIVTPSAQVVLLDAVYGAPVERLAFSRHALWTTFGILSAPSTGPVRLDARADIAQAALSAAALALGRPLTSSSAPDLHLLVSELSDIAQIRSGERFGDAIRTFFQTALPRAGQPSISADALCADVSRLADRIGVDTALGALSELVRSSPAALRSGSGFSNDDEVVAEGQEPDVPVEVEAEPPPAVLERKPLPVAVKADPLPALDEASEPVEPPAPSRVTPDPMHGATPAPEPSRPAPPSSTLPAEFLPVSAPAHEEPPTPKELAAPPPAPAVVPAPAPPPPLPPLVAPTVQETFEIAASLPPPAPEPPRSWVPAATSAPWPPPAAEVPPPPPPAPPPPPTPTGWTVATSISPSPAPTVFAAPVSNVPPPPAPPFGAPSIGIAPPPVAPPPQSPFGLAPAPVLVAPPPAPAPAPVQLQPPQKLKLKSDGPAGYTPVRATTSASRPVDHGSVSHSVPFIDRLAAEQEERRFPWKIVAAAAVVVLLVGGVAGRDYLLGRGEPAPAATEPAAPAKPVAAPTVGALDIKSLPSGARVILDGDEVGVTPLVLESVSPGRHTLVVSTDTASVKRTIRIEAGKTVALDLSVFAGWVAIFSPIPLHISQDGRALGTSDSGKILLPPGRQVLTLTNTEYGYSAKQTVEVVAGEERAVNITPKGTVNVNAQPWAEVWVDGQRVGETPIANLEVTLGTREFVFKHPQYGERKTVTTVTSTPSAISIDFTKQN